MFIFRCLLTFLWGKLFYLRYLVADELNNQTEQMAKELAQQVEKVFKDTASTLNKVDALKLPTVDTDKITKDAADISEGVRFFLFYLS